MNTDETIAVQPQTFDQEIARAMRDSIIKIIRAGDWCKVDYNARVPLDATFLRKVQGSVNMDNVLGLIVERVEKHIADSIYNAMATEITTDVKKIMSNTELREDIRATLRAKMRAEYEAVGE